MYPLISGQSNIPNLEFLDGDLILVPKKGNTVSVSGSVRVPAFFEIKTMSSVRYYLIQVEQIDMPAIGCLYIVISWKTKILTNLMILYLLMEIVLLCQLLEKI